jgi:hypothetical protein
LIEYEVEANQAGISCFLLGLATTPIKLRTASVMAYVSSPETAKTYHDINNEFHQSISVRLM